LLLVTLASWAGAADTLDDDPPAGEPHPQDVAVIVGNEDYAFLPDVPYAIRDADLVYAALVTTRGIPPERVWDLRGANREQILAAVDGAVAGVGPQGTVWFYFAGHGAASPSTTAPLLVGDDAKRQAEVFEGRSVSVPEIEARVGARRLVLVTDACFAGAGRNGEALVPGARFAVPAWAEASGHDHLVVTAAAPDQVAGPYDAVDHGLFTWLFVGGLRGWADGSGGAARDGRVTTAEVDAWVDKALRALQVDDQRPVWTGGEEWVLSAAADLELPPHHRGLPRPGAEVVVAPSPSASPGNPWVPPYHHVSGTSWSDANGLAMPGPQVRLLASQDAAGQDAVRKMRTVPYSMAGAGVLAGYGVILGATLLPLSASSTFADSPGDASGFRTGGIVSLSVAAASIGWEVWLGGRLKKHRRDVAEYAARSADP
jgi:hypothetical protein